MIKRLRIRAIAAATLAAFAVLGVIMGAVNAANFIKIKNSADTLTEVLAENGGRFAPPPQIDDGNVFGQGGQSDRQNVAPPDVMRGETPYETRYFTVREVNGEYVFTLDNVATVNADKAKELVEQAKNGNFEVGYAGNYRYRISEKDGEKVFIFVDCFKDLENARSFLKYSAIISSLGLTAVFLLMIFLSGKIVKPIAENYEKQKTFITDAGHELKTPLTIISANNELIALEYGENESTSAIERQVAKMTAMVKNLTALSRLDEAKSIMKKEFSISEAIKEVADNFLPAIKRRGIELKTSVMSGVCYDGDENLIRQLFSILFDNLLKYSVGDAELTLIKEGGKIKISLSNAAKGIKDGDLSAVFDRFYRSAESRASETEGSGIGLSVAKEIVGIHGGKISASGKNGVFTVDIIL